MQRPRSLVSDSPLVQATFEFTCAHGGRVAYAKVAEVVLDITNASDTLAASLVADLIQNDPRFTIEGQQLVVNQTNLDDTCLDEIDFVVVDVEAIGGRSIPKRAIEIGACHVNAGHIDRQFETLLNVELPLPRFVSTLTGITDEMLATAPKFHEILDPWLDFVGDSILVAHNSAFDIGLLNQEIARVFPGCEMRNSEICTVELSRRVAPFLENHNLDALADHWGFEISRRHRALPDALATAQIFLRLMDELENRGVRTVGQARSFKLSRDDSKSRQDLVLHP